MVRTVVSVNDLKFSYDSNVDLVSQKVLDIPNLKINEGESVFMYGPSGSGKTTLLGILALVLRAQSGNISILGQDLSHLPQSQWDQFRGNNIGYIFQMLNLIPYLSTMENILLPLKLNKQRAQRVLKNSLKDDQADFRKILYQEAMELSFQLKIDSLIEKSVSRLSVGQQQRVAIARALIGSPGLIIADEPTSSLDFKARDLFLDLLLKQAKKNSSTVLFVSHDQSLMNYFERAIDICEVNRGSKNVI